MHLVNFRRFDKANNCCENLSAFMHITPLLKIVYSKRKEFAPNESKFFSFRVDPFSEESQNNFDTVTFTEKDTAFLTIKFIGKVPSIINKVTRVFTTD